ncbi:hypothetical protein MTAT_04720 [Moorella thermoacetica]|uniref:Uncharacterized protein n=1 Tax=Neomoorella thermoacetica TaxID=1525 RepID=A0AAC9HIZ3_NEOTH|nr:hypothetical protein [Moorella thermoacetica]AOQ24729.1 hypothetical protein Maut_02301 [Moorella thermoacetica]TYL15733.1 hypothetical protein MTAT_04720 [Moorella thermoacetica]
MPRTKVTDRDIRLDIQKEFPVVSEALFQYFLDIIKGNFIPSGGVPTINTDGARVDIAAGVGYVLGQRVSFGAVTLGPFPSSTTQNIYLDTDGIKTTILDVPPGRSIIATVVVDALGKIQTLIDKRGTSFYKLPLDGIPREHLATSVTGSLDAADSINMELQSARAGYVDLSARLAALESMLGNSFHETYIAQAGQRVFNLTNSYVAGSRKLKVFINSILAHEGPDSDYIETDNHTVTFNYDLVEGDVVDFWMPQGGAVIASTVASGAYLYEEYIATAGQTVFKLAGIYPVGNHSLQVFLNGLLQRPGQDNDYLEVDNRTVQFNRPLEAGSVVTFLVPGKNNVSLQETEMVLVDKTLSTQEISGTVNFDINLDYPKVLLKTIRITSSAPAEYSFQIMNKAVGGVADYTSPIVSGEFYSMIDLPYVDEDNATNLHLKITTSAPASFIVKIRGLKLV